MSEKKPKKLRFYTVLRLAKEDIINEGFDPSKLTSDEMKDFSFDLGDILLEGGAWDLGIQELAKKYELPGVKD